MSDEHYVTWEPFSFCVCERALEDVKLESMQMQAHIIEMRKGPSPSNTVIRKTDA